MSFTYWASHRARQSARYSWAVLAYSPEDALAIAKAENPQNTVERGLWSSGSGPYATYSIGSRMVPAMKRPKGMEDPTAPPKIDKALLRSALGLEP